DRKKERAWHAGGVTPQSSGSTGAAPSKSKRAGGGATAGQSPALKPGAETKKPAGVTGQSSTTGAATNGLATPTPTPKPKATPAKKTNSSAPSGTGEKKPAQPETEPAATPTATPSTTQEKPPR